MEKVKMNEEDIKLFEQVNQDLKDEELIKKELRLVNETIFVSPKPSSRRVSIDEVNLGDDYLIITLKTECKWPEYVGFELPDEGIYYYIDDSYGQFGLFIPHTLQKKYGLYHNPFIRTDKYECELLFLRGASQFGDESEML